MTATNHNGELGEIYAAMLNELNCTFGVSFSHLHCCGRHGHGLWPSWYRTRTWAGVSCQCKHWVYTYNALLTTEIDECKKPKMHCMLIPQTIMLMLWFAVVCLSVSLSVCLQY